MLVQEPVQAAIWHMLNHYRYGNAKKLAYVLNNEVNTEDSLYLLATCYYRAGDLNQCYSALQAKETQENSLNSRCRFLLVQCCIDLKKFSDAEAVLMRKCKPNSDPVDAVVEYYGDSSPFACELLGVIATQTDRRELATKAVRRSLKLNPFLWESYTTLCQFEENVNPATVFQTDHLESFSTCHGTQTVVSLVGNQNQEPVVMGVCNMNSVDIQPRSVSAQWSSAKPRGVGNVKPVPVVPLPEELGGVLHPSNKNRPAKFRNLFTSTPIGANTVSAFGFLPLETSTDSPNQNSIHHAMSPCPSAFMMISPAPHHESSEPRPKKPCLRVPPSWQQQPQAGSVLTTHSPSSTQTPQQQPLNTQTANVRRSSRLFSNSNVSVKENNKTPPTRGRITPSKSPSRKNKLRGSRSATVTSNNNSTYQENQKNSQILDGDIPGMIDQELGAGDYRFVTPIGNEKSLSVSVANILGGTPPCNSPMMAQTALALQKQSAEGLMSLYREIGKAYNHLNKFECKEAIECFLNLRSQHSSSGWILAQIAKAFFEKGDYEEAVRYYGLMRTKEPYRFEGLEWLSTALWHLQQEIELSALASDLMTLDRQHPSTWIAAGNCFSLHKEHETAIKFFERAIQVDPSCAYGYTLLGHEYVATEELEKAMRCFRNAGKLDRRHYNAWYGIGMIFYKQERYLRAEVYYRKALGIHPNNSVLLCHLGVVQHALNRTDKSLASFGKALKANPLDPLCKFHRASVLFAVNRLDEALSELEELKHIVPKESLVYFLIAKVFSKKGDTHKALLHFSWATDLDPKGANNQIKESIEPVLSKSLTPMVNMPETEDNTGLGSDDDEAGDVTVHDGMEMDIARVPESDVESQSDVDVGDAYISNYPETI